MTSTPSGHSDGPHRYRIRLEGRVDARWSALFEGLRLTTGDGFTLLEGAVVDQAALHGVLQQLRDLGLPLISVTRLPEDVETASNHPDTTSPGA